MGQASLLSPPSSNINVNSIIKHCLHIFPEHGIVQVSDEESM